MNIKRCIFLSGVFVFFVGVCSGAEFVRGEITSAWGKSPLRQTCGNHQGSSFFCVGNQADCNNSTATAPNNSDAHGVMMLVAMAGEKTDNNGAMFYPVLLLSESNCYGGCTTTRNVGGWNYGTPLCNPKAHGSCLGYNNQCYNGEFNANKFSTITTRDCLDTNTEWDLQAFYADNYTWSNCKSGEWYGEDTVILGVEKFESGGHGAWVRPYGYRAYRENKIKKVAIYPISLESSQLWCVPGYAPDSNGTKCIQVASVAACGTWCPGWGKDMYEKYKSERVYKDVNGCLQSRCKDPKKAFDKNWRCTVDCIKDGRNGISPEDGTCVTCPDGQVFDEKASQSSGYCKKATTINTEVLQYGTKGQNADFDKQCWAMSDDAQYKDCVLGKEVVKKKIPVVEIKKLNIKPTVATQKVKSI